MGQSTRTAKEHVHPLEPVRSVFQRNAPLGPAGGSFRMIVYSRYQLRNRYPQASRDANQDADRRPDKALFDLAHVNAMNAAMGGKCFLRQAGLATEASDPLSQTPLDQEAVFSLHSLGFVIVYRMCHSIFSGIKFGVGIMTRMILTSLARVPESQQQYSPKPT